MAFTATLTINLNKEGTVVSLTQPACYWKIDGSSGFPGGKDAGAYTATVRCYSNQAVRDNDLGDDYPPASYKVSAAYVEGADPYALLYPVAMARFPDAVAI